MLTDKPSYFEKRVVRKCYPFFIVWFLIFFTSFAASFSSSFAEEEKILPEIKEVRIVAQSGAVSLALKLIDQEQKNIENKDNLAVWLQWERERLNIYQLGKRWKSLQQRVASYKNNLPDNFYFWVKQQQVDALLKLKQGQQARDVLFKLIWSKKEKTAKQIRIHSQWLPLWQKRVIRSYLVDDDKEDALLSAQRYYQDYRADEIEDRLLRARILLVNQREEEVVELLVKDTKHPEGGMLYLLAQLRSKARPARKVLQSALRQMRGKWASEKLRYMLWAVVAESAKQGGDKASTANALEFVIAGNSNIELPAGLFHFSATTLWEAYIDYALHLGNRAQFLIGNDQQWLNAAIKAQKKEPVKARSFYAMVMLQGQSNETRSRAAKGFLNLMHKRKRGAELITQLFLNSRNFKILESVPTPIRYDLVKIALSRSNINLASNLMATIKTAPAGVDSFQWQLRRARIFVLGGKAEKGSETLHDLILQNKSFTREQLDQFLQVVFDLQTAKEHEFAYQLFYSILPKISDVTLQREIYYWMADSRKAQQNYAAAAQLYLRSALHAGNNGLDPWGQTARYQVAEMLTKADFLQDAHTFYEELLRTTKEPARRAVLKHELQKLWLLRAPKEEKESLLQ